MHEFWSSRSGALTVHTPPSSPALVTDAASADTVLRVPPSDMDSRSITIVRRSQVHQPHEPSCNGFLYRIWSRNFERARRAKRASSWAKEAHENSLRKRQMIMKYKYINESSSLLLGHHCASQWSRVGLLRSIVVHDKEKLVSMPAIMTEWLLSSSAPRARRAQLSRRGRTLSGLGCASGRALHAKPADNDGVGVRVSISWQAARPKLQADACILHG